MKKLIATASLAGLVALAAAISAQGGSSGVAHPQKIAKDEVAGKIFERANVIKESKNGNSTLDVTTLKSSDGKFASGMYRSGPSRFEVTKPYGVDEFMYFVEGGVTLTSSDGNKQVVGAGEAVTIPKEWTGVWETDGYTKIWVIYSEDGSGL
jgi:uncharacterized cupin superfamily protein